MSLSKAEIELAQRMGVDVTQLEVLRTLIESFKDVIVELIRATQANPVMGVFVGLSGTSILKKIGIIDPAIYQILVGYISVGAGFDLLKELLNPTGNADLIRPTPVTLTRADGQHDGSAGVDPAQIASILGLVAKVAK